MALDFRKVEVGTTINFNKDLNQSVLGGVVTFNLNWGMVNGRSVDLDAVAVFERRGSFIPPAQSMFQRIKNTLGGSASESLSFRPTTIYYGNLGAKGIQHHGDDLTGAWAEGEYIEIDLDKIDQAIDTITFGVLSYSGHAFNTLPFATIKVFKGKPTHQEFGLVENELVQFAGTTRSVIMAQLKRNVMGEWEFTAMSVELPTKDVTTLSNKMRKT